MNVSNYGSKDNEKFSIANGMNASNVDRTSEIKTYNHPLFGSVRMFVENGKAWFCATDIASSLGYVNPRDAIATHCKPASVVNRDVGVQTGLKKDGTPAIQTRNMKFISEGNIYRLTAKSELPKAEEFESWIFDDLVPTVINTGSYSLQQNPLPQIPLSRKELALMVIQAEEEKEKLQLENKDLYQQVEKQRPAVVFTESVKVSSTNILMRDLAKIITQNGYKIGEQRLYDWMVKNKYLIRHRRWSKSQSKYMNYYTPTQWAAEKNLFWVSERPISNPGQQPFTSFTCYVTGEGQVYFVNEFKNLTISM